MKKKNQLKLIKLNQKHKQKNKTKMSLCAFMVLILTARATRHDRH